MTQKGVDVRTRTVIFNEGGEVLVQHHPAETDDFYRLPGGGVKFRESLEDCVVREIREETGLIVRVERLLWVRDFLEDFPDHSIEFFFLAVIDGGEFRPDLGLETELEFSFMSLEELKTVVFYPKEIIPKLRILKTDREWREDNLYVGSIN